MRLSSSGEAVAESPGTRFRRAHRDELGRRARALRDWTRIWEASGVALAHHAIDDDHRLRCRPTDPGHVLRHDGTTRLRVGDLVAVRDVGTPDDVNQHLRRVERILPADPGGAALAALGAAIPREEWPDSMRAATVPVGLDVRDGGAGVVVVTEGERVVATLASEDGAGSRQVLGLVRAASRVGQEDALGGSERSAFEARPGRDEEGRRSWNLVDTWGRVYASEPRSVMQRRDRPPERMLALVALTRAAASHAGRVSGHEDRDRSRPTHGDDRDHPSSNPFAYG